MHQLRQFLQTSSLANEQGLESLIEHFLAKPAKTDIIRDKIDFLLVQYFSQLAPSGVTDAEVDLAYVAKALKPVLGEVELKPPVWLNALDRVLESSRALPFARRTSARRHSGAGTQGQGPGRRLVLSAGRHGGFHPLRIPHAARLSFA